jgi:hypothetical protein
VRDNDVDAKSDELSRNLGSTVAAPTGVAELERNIRTFRITKRLQSTSEGAGEWMRLRRRYQHAYERQFSRLLRPRRERPRGCRAAEQRDELAPLHLPPLLPGQRGPAHRHPCHIGPCLSIRNS